MIICPIEDKEQKLETCIVADLKLHSECLKSLLGPLLFNIFIVNLFFILKDVDIANFPNVKHLSQKIMKI